MGNCFQNRPENEKEDFYKKGKSHTKQTMPECNSNHKTERKQNKGSSRSFEMRNSGKGPKPREIGRDVYVGNHYFMVVRVVVVVVVRV